MCGVGEEVLGVEIWKERRMDGVMEEEGRAWQAFTLVGSLFFFYLKGISIARALRGVYVMLCLLWKFFLFFYTFLTGLVGLG